MKVVLKENLLKIYQKDSKRLNGNSHRNLIHILNESFLDLKNRKKINDLKNNSEDISL